MCRGAHRRDQHCTGPHCVWVFPGECQCVCVCTHTPLPHSVYLCVSCQFVEHHTQLVLNLLPQNAAAKVFPRSADGLSELPYIWYIHMWVWLRFILIKATMGRRGAKFSLVLIKSQTAFPCGTRSFSLRRVFFRGFVNELAQQNRIKNTSKLMTLRPGEAEFCVERKLVATSTASHSKCGQHLCNLFSWLFAELLDARACC